MENKVAGVVPPADDQLLKALVQLLLEERQQVLEEKKAKLEQYNVRDKARRKLSEYNEQEEKNKQKLCTHLKNQPSKTHFTPKSPKIDYAVSHHTFPDGNTYIKCLICGMKWKRDDTDEFLVRDGVKVKNHTGIGWRQAIRMVAESTNTATSSEIVVGRPEALSGEVETAV